MLDAKTLQDYTNCATELQKLMDFSSKNNYLLTNGFTNGLKVIFLKYSPGMKIIKTILNYITILV